MNKLEDEVSATRIGLFNFSKVACNVGWLDFGKDQAPRRSYFQFCFNYLNAPKKKILQEDGKQNKNKKCNFLVLTKTMR